MRLSKRSEYALRALFCLARSAPARVWQIQEISRHENIPVKFLEQILLALRHAGVLASRRGVRGGYFFARLPSRITVGEVVRLMDGPIAPVPCTSPSPGEKCTCPDPARCVLRLFMSEVRDGLTEILDNRTIEAVVRLHPQSDPLEFQI